MNDQLIMNTGIVGIVAKTSLMFSKFPNLMAEYLGNKRCLEHEYIQVRLRDKGVHLSMIFYFT